LFVIPANRLLWKERGASKFCSEWTLADTGNNGFVWLGNITDMDGMSAFLSTDGEIKWDRDNGCFLI
jgi:hypothetical protein